MFTREGSSSNNNRRLTGDMQQAKSLRGTWREYTLYFLVGYKSLLSEASYMYSKLLFHVYRPRILKTFEAVAFAPKPRTDARFIANALLFSVVGKARLVFVRRTAFVLALEHSSGTKFADFPQVQRFLDKSDKSLIR